MTMRHGIDWILEVIKPEELEKEINLPRIRLLISLLFRSLPFIQHGQFKGTPESIAQVIIHRIPLQRFLHRAYTLSLRKKCHGRSSSSLLSTSDLGAQLPFCG